MLDFLRGKFMRTDRTAIVADATCDNIIPGTASKCPVNFQANGADAFRVTAAGGTRLYVDSNGALHLVGAMRFRSDAITGTTDPGFDMTAAIGAARTILRVATATNTANRWINLPAANTVGIGQVFVFYDATGEAATKNITINRRGSDTINGANTKVISTAYGGAILIADSSTTWIAFSIPGL